MIEIDIILVGNVKESIDKNYLRKWKSNIFKISTVTELELIGDIEFSEPNCTYSKIKNSINANRLTFAISNYYFDGNLITVPLTNQLVNLSIYDFDKMLKVEKLKLEKFILRFIYGIVSIYLTSNNNLPSNTNLIHQNVRGCLFDYCKRHIDGLKFHENPKLCSESIAELEKKQKPEKFVENLISEIEKLKRTNIEKIELWVNNNQALTIFITTVIGFVLGLIK